VTCCFQSHHQPGFDDYHADAGAENGDGGDDVVGCDDDDGGVGCYYY